ncbi:purine and uridine phosphorylase [Dissoconium aciculare CBS 342.82]|uniref:Purine and uridine phosphorylase n=1 Tax=Dissoconium aciculare CBS 342.82 TaxID=1314786 RepID=A0A6J3LRI1_9PEZI|nr:purine and uridine phosphorylase [Dissoconium aciculare CBS 342.82]KAF1818228.1 purine and uridine phosphorylase [Dissoconium aciculare CBS 342.82]
MATKTLSHDDYTVAWISPIEVEQVAAIAMLDVEHPRLTQSLVDYNAYQLGNIAGHNVVIASLDSAGNASAATVITQMRNTFKQLRFGLLVGIGGGVPIKTSEGWIRLGHVIVSKPTGTDSGVIQYDYGKAQANGVFERTGSLAPPPKVLLNAAQLMSAKRKHFVEDPLKANLQLINTSLRDLRKYKHPGPDKDHLYRADYLHADKTLLCQKCSCEPSMRVDRGANNDDSDEEDEDDFDRFVVHRGNIAAGEKVLRNSVERDALAKTNNVICFEMEAAGATNDFPCLVIRGVSDYCDSHKNDKWHGYAAATAAAYARELFKYMPVDEVRQCGVAEPYDPALKEAIQRLEANKASNTWNNYDNTQVMNQVTGNQTFTGGQNFSF